MHGNSDRQALQFFCGARPLSGGVTEEVVLFPCVSVTIGKRLRHFLQEVLGAAGVSFVELIQLTGRGHHPLEAPLQDVLWRRPLER